MHEFIMSKDEEDPDHCQTSPDEMKDRKNFKVLLINLSLVSR